MIFPLAAALAVIGAKIWMIAQNGSPTPFWDQWDAEGAFLYPQYLNGTLTFSDLITPHNEHRILVTRLWSLLLLDLEGYWDPILQMLANTLLLGGFVALLVASFRPMLDAASWIAFALFAAVIYALPFGWESTLAGFQSSWYFMLLFSVGGLLAIIEAAAFSARWWLALLLVLVSYFSLASGALTAAAAFAICAVQFAVGRRSGTVEWLALVMLAAMTAVMMLYIPILAPQAVYKSHSVGQFLHALMQIMSWPAVPNDAGSLPLIAGAILIQAPVLLISLCVIWLRPPVADRRWLLVVLTGWTILQAAGVAYGRATIATSSRYLDVWVVIILLDYACLLYALNLFPISWLQRSLAPGATVFWLLLVLFGATKAIFTRTLPEIAQRAASYQAENLNFRAYLETGDIRVLENKPTLDIPYPSPKRLAQIVSNPSVRAILPPALVGEASAARAQQHGLAQYTGRPIETLKYYALRWGVLLMPAGLVLFLMGLTMQWRRETENTPASG